MHTRSTVAPCSTRMSRRVMPSRIVRPSSPALFPGGRTSIGVRVPSLAKLAANAARASGRQRAEELVLPRADAQVRERHLSYLGLAISG